MNTRPPLANWPVSITFAAMLSKVHVALRTLSGDEVEIQADPDTSVQELKRQIAQDREILPDCVKLMLGSDVLLENTLTLSDYASDAIIDGTVATLQLLMLVSLDAVHERLRSASSYTRQLAMVTLVRLTPKGNAGVLEALRSRLNDSCPEVRETALRMMAQIVGEVEEGMAEEVMACLKDASLHVQREALVTLPKFASTGDERTICAVCESLESKHVIVRREAIETLARLTAIPRGDPRVITEITKRLGNQEPERAYIRATAAEAMGKLDNQGSEATMAQLRELCQDDYEEVRIAALGALAALAAQGDEKAILAVLESVSVAVSEGDRKTCKAALDALPRVALSGDARAVDILLMALGASADARGSQCEIRRAALESLSIVTDKGNEAVIKAVCQCLEDKDPVVRQSAAETLSRVALTGQDCAVSSCVLLFGHAKADIRKSAVEAFAGIAGHEDSFIDTMVPCLEDQHPHVRLAALDGLVRIAGKGNEHALSKVGALLESPKGHVQRAAEEALSRLR